MKYILDTCVISEMIKPVPNQRIIDWVSGQNENDLFLSVITLGEIQKGISKLTESKKQRTLELWLKNDLVERFNGRIVPIDGQVALTWGIIQALAEKNGHPIPSIDGLIAATGITLNMTIVTRKEKDMEPSGALIFNPWLELS